MCYQSAGPRGSDTLGDATLERDVLLRVVAQALDVPTLEPRLQLVGGEALLRLDDCLAVVETAARAGFQSISIATNAFWARRPKVADAHCARLADAGLTSLEVSFDAWHLPWVEGETVSNALEAASRRGLPVTLRVLTSRDHGVDDTLARLRPAALDAATRIHCTTVASTGRAGRELAPGEFLARGDLTAACHRELSLTVNPAGDVFPCCSGLDQTRALGFGNVRERSVVAIAAEMSASPLLRRIVFEGVGSLVPLLEHAGVTVADPHSSICSLCWSLFSRDDCVTALRALFPEEPFRPPAAAGD